MAREGVRGQEGGEVMQDEGGQEGGGEDRERLRRWLTLCKHPPPTTTTSGYGRGPPGNSTLHLQKYTPMKEQGSVLELWDDNH